MNNANLTELLAYIEPAVLDYQTWVNVGMALKDAGFTASEWDKWSQRDAGRYHPGECFRKWDTFRGCQNPVTTGTIVQLARDHGWKPERAEYELEWDAIIGAREDLVVIDKNWVEGREIAEQNDWNPVSQLVQYLEILFEASENVGYVTDSWEKDGKYMPTKGACDRTAGQLIQQLNQCNGDIGAVLGDYNSTAGAWIRFNPLDGNGVKNENVTDFRYALVESDVMEIEKQNAILRELELPIACLVHSGKKSLHAIVKVDAPNYEDYRKRVDYLYDVCKKNGLKIDSQNRNPSRLSRMPGVMRDGARQFLVDTNIGKDNWTQWKEWIEGVNDDLPEPESMFEVWDNLPNLAPPLIDGVLRQGHKMLLAGPSKAGKSFALITLCCSIAEGRAWLGWNCTQGRVLYVNLELDRASCLHRFKDVYSALHWAPNSLENIDVWNLRGKAVPMDRLAPKLIRRAQKKNYIAIVIDPIYKVITGDENSADQMANFCNQFDRVCTELGAAVIYCHHHSKGSQGNKRSMDRASGSGVFARDPDTLLDLIELEVNETVVFQEQSKAICDTCVKVLNAEVPTWGPTVPHDDRSNPIKMLANLKSMLKKEQHHKAMLKIDEAKRAVSGRSAWRIDGTLREYPKFKPVDIWFDYPIHQIDTAGVLRDADPEGEKPPWQKAIEKRKSPEKKKEERQSAIEIAYSALEFDTDKDITTSDLAEEMGVTVRTVWNRIKEHGGFNVETSDGKSSIVKRKDIENEKL